MWQRLASRCSKITAARCCKATPAAATLPRLFRSALFGGAATEKRVREELMNYSDFSLHAFCYNAGPDFASFRLNQSHMMASAKFRFLAKLLKEVRRVEAELPQAPWSGRQANGSALPPALLRSPRLLHHFLRQRTPGQWRMTRTCCECRPTCSLPPALQLKAVGSRPLIFSQWTAVLGKVGGVAGCVVEGGMPVLPAFQPWSN